MTAAVPGAAGGQLLPARPLAAQAHALRAAAAFIERAGIPGLSLTIDDERIVIQVPADLAGPARSAAVARLAAAAGGRAVRDDCPGRTLGWIRADGQVAGHHVRIFTAITEETP
jgi:rhodanese-related sulfurtransferase